MEKVFTSYHVNLSTASSAGMDACGHSGSGLGENASETSLGEAGTEHRM